MKKLQQISLATIAMLSISANAAVSYGNPSVGQVYAGAKIGQIDANKPKNTTVYGVYAGYNFDQNLGIEAEYLNSDAKDYHADGLEHKYEATSYGAYGTYRYPLNNTSFYAKGKLGVAKTKVEGTAGVVSQKAPLPDPIRVTKSFKEDKTSLAGGIGMGFTQGNFGVEAGYNYLNNDVKTWNAGVHFAF